MEITKEITYEITDIMQALGIRPHLKGYRYIRTALETILEDVSYLDKITALYAVIAKTHDSSSSKVERAIRHSINVGCSHMDSRTREAYCKYVNIVCKDDSKPIHVVNSMFMASIADYIIIRHKAIEQKTLELQISKEESDIKEDYFIKLYDENRECVQEMTFNLSKNMIDSISYLSITNQENTVKRILSIETKP